jgi:hypothetical protein
MARARWRQLVSGALLLRCQWSHCVQQHPQGCHTAWAVGHSWAMHTAACKPACTYVSCTHHRLLQDTRGQHAVEAASRPRQEHGRHASTGDLHQLHLTHALQLDERQPSAAHNRPRHVKQEATLVARRSHDLKAGARARLLCSPPPLPRAPVHVHVFKAPDDANAQRTGQTRTATARSPVAMCSPSRPGA